MSENTGRLRVSVSSDEDRLDVSVNENGCVEVALGPVDGTTPHIATFTHEQWAWVCRVSVLTIEQYADLKDEARG